MESDLFWLSVLSLFAEFPTIFHLAACCQTQHGAAAFHCSIFRGLEGDNLTTPLSPSTSTGIEGASKDRAGLLRAHSHLAQLNRARDV